MFILKKMLHFVILVFTLIAVKTSFCSISLNESLTAKDEKVNYRLPQNVKPIRYTVTLEPKLEPKVDPAPLNGTVNIELQPLENTYNITLHIKSINITRGSMTITHSSGSRIQFHSISEDAVRDFLIIYLEQQLLKDEIYNLTITDYTGTLDHTDYAGFYLAKYYDRLGHERRFATTQFSSLGARRVFPCFDEPHLKATFIVNLIRNEKYISISNEKRIRTTYLGNGRYQDTFKETVRMSTYVVAFVVTEYTSKNSSHRQRVYGDKYDIAEGQGDFALKVGIQTLPMIERYLGIKYVSTKLDQIAIPAKYFAPGAMENWGLVTYNKNYLIYPYKEAITREIEKTVVTITHEYAHQWFGNLVTCSWWRYIWLNEGFAQYYGYYFASMVRPKWRLMEQFMHNSVQLALYNDKSSSNQPMNYEPDYPGTGPDNWISYQKSGSIIRMFEHFITTSVLKEGLQFYLKNNAFGSVQPSDLYAALQYAVNRNNKQSLVGNLSVSEILTTWDSQAGCPIVNVSRNYKSGQITFYQNRQSAKELKPEENYIWYIPINFVFGSAEKLSFNQTTADFWLTQRTLTLNESFPTNSWVIVNKQQTGYYRVNYDKNNWNRIINYLRKSSINRIHLINRAQLVDDSFNLAEIGQLHYHVPLNLSKYLTKETEYLPLMTFSTILRFLNIRLAAEPEYELLQSYVNSLLAHAMEKLGFEEKTDDHHLEKLNRINVLTWMCKFGNSECRLNSLNAFRLWQQNSSSSITLNLEELKLCEAMRVGNQNDWNFLFEKYQASGNTTRRNRLLNALGCVENKDTLDRFLDKILDNSLIKVDWMPAITACINAGNFGLSTTFEYVSKHFDELVDKIQMSRVLSEIGQKFTTTDQLNKLKELSNKHPNQNSLFTTAIKNTENNIKWNEKYVSGIKRWLKDNYSL